MKGETKSRLSPNERRDQVKIESKCEHSRGEWESFNAEGLRCGIYRVDIHYSVCDKVSVQTFKAEGYTYLDYMLIFQTVFHCKSRSLTLGYCLSIT